MASLVYDAALILFLWCSAFCFVMQCFSALHHITLSYCGTKLGVFAVHCTIIFAVQHYILLQLCVLCCIMLLFFASWAFCCCNAACFWMVLSSLFCFAVKSSVNFAVHHVQDGLFLFVVWHSVVCIASWHSFFLWCRLFSMQHFLFLHCITLLFLMWCGALCFCVAFVLLFLFAALHSFVFATVLFVFHCVTSLFLYAVWAFCFCNAALFVVVLYHAALSFCSRELCVIALLFLFCSATLVFCNTVLFRFSLCCTFYLFLWHGAIFALCFFLQHSALWILPGSTCCFCIASYPSYFLWHRALCFCVALHHSLFCSMTLYLFAAQHSVFLFGVVLLFLKFVA